VSLGLFYITLEEKIFTKFLGLIVVFLLDFGLIFEYFHVQGLIPKLYYFLTIG